MFLTRRPYLLHHQQGGEGDGERCSPSMKRMVPCMSQKCRWGIGLVHDGAATDIVLTCSATSTCRGWRQRPKKLAVRQFACDDMFRDWISSATGNLIMQRSPPWRGGSLMVTDNPLPPAPLWQAHMTHFINPGDEDAVSRPEPSALSVY